MKKHFIMAFFAGAMLATPALAFDLGANADKAAEILNTDGVEAGATKIGDAATGLVALDNGFGLHVWAMGDDGKILFDFSGQTKPGEDLNTFNLSDGRSIVAVIKEAVDKGGGKADIKLGPDVPHPVTNELKPSEMACDRLQNKAIVCAMAWP